jgi:hypothetical protein
MIQKWPGTVKRRTRRERSGRGTGARASACERQGRSGACERQACEVAWPCGVDGANEARGCGGARGRGCERVRSAGVQSGACGADGRGESNPADVDLGMVPPRCRRHAWGVRERTPGEVCGVQDEARRAAGGSGRYGTLHRVN